MNVLLVCNLGKAIGIGHLSRLLIVAQALVKKNNYNINFLIQGPYVKDQRLSKYALFIVEEDESINKALLVNQFDIVIVDINERFCSEDISVGLNYQKQSGAILIGIDALFKYEKILDLIFIPSFYIDSRSLDLTNAKVVYGWDCYLLEDNEENRNKHISKSSINTLILTGGSDPMSLGDHWPQELDDNLTINHEINWVVGPYSDRPILPRNPKTKIIEHVSPAGLSSLIKQADIAACVYGVSFFELLKFGIPTVVLSPYEGKDNKELELISEMEIALVANNTSDACAKLIELSQDKVKSELIARNAKARMNRHGIDRLIKEIAELQA